jgi:hypothetical protein
MCVSIHHFFKIQFQYIDLTPRILIVCMWVVYFFPVEIEFSFVFVMKVTRLIPDANGTTCNQRLEKVCGTEHTHILRVPFRSEKGILRKWISRFDVWPFLETFARVNFIIYLELLPLLWTFSLESMTSNLSLSMRKIFNTENLS